MHADLERAKRGSVSAPPATHMRHEPIQITLTHDDLVSNDSFLDRDEVVEAPKFKTVEVKPTLRKPPSIIELDEPHFKSLMKKMFDQVDKERHGFIDGSKANFGRGLARRFLQADPKKFTRRELNNLMTSIEKCFTGIKPSSGSSFTFMDIYRGARKWWFENHIKKPSARRQPLHRKMTEKQFAINLQNLFNKYDENMNGGIDFGAEFDAFLVEYNVLIGNNLNMSNASRDQLREAFALVDSSKDGVVTFDEIYPNAL